MIDIGMVLNWCMSDRGSSVYFLLVSFIVMFGVVMVLMMVLMSNWVMEWFMYMCMFLLNDVVLCCGCERL